ncbi:hypothetical protein C942_01527 [Photobacterium marinum]|uniref:Uncharacterized protein n=1 Tax=Photobacterium marinum TaxID=1056511 RepID=L8JJI5_9GAMM|nr:hypothetical protein C942_01527 [Photobacterium marinum]
MLKDDIEFLFAFVCSALHGYCRRVIQRVCWGSNANLYSSGQTVFVIWCWESTSGERPLLKAVDAINSL